MAEKRKIPLSMAVEEYERMINRPYKSNFNDAYYAAPTTSRLGGSQNGYTYTGEGASNKAGAGRGFVNPSMESSTPATDAAKKQADEDKDFEKYSKERPDQKYAKGGSASSRADGCCSKGKTKGRFV
jgi:hypothetical protein